VNVVVQCRSRRYIKRCELHACRNTVAGCYPAFSVSVQGSQSAVYSLDELILELSLDVTHSFSGVAQTAPFLAITIPSDRNTSKGVLGNAQAWFNVVLQASNAPRISYCSNLLLPQRIKCLPGIGVMIRQTMLAGILSSGYNSDLARFFKEEVSN
jgi:hypothetical protein